MFCNQRNVSIKDNINNDCCAEIHVMHNGVLGFQTNGALKGGVTFLRLDLFGTKFWHFCILKIFVRWLKH